VADLVEAWPRDVPAGAPAARFWLDRETGLVLRREVVDAAGRTVLATAFLDLQVPAAGPPAGPAPVPSPEPALEPADPEALRAEGWPVPPTLAGLELHETRAGGTGPDRLVQLAYSDGLLGVSVFAQPGELDHRALQGWELRRVGAAEVWVADSVPQRVAWTAGGTVFTVLADAPAGTLDEAVDGLPHDHPGALEAAASDLRERLARGLSRVADWASPTAA
jgi:sigma-E factor negative regulatory protein RseB